MNFLNSKLLTLGFILTSSNNAASTTQIIPNSTNAVFYATCITQALLAVNPFKYIKSENTVLYSPKSTTTTVLLAESKPKKPLITKYSNATKKTFPKQPKASRQSFANCKRTR